ncbi:endonuclease NucS domain-containing protein [Halomarina litorea]|uniref:endonuclease NucS domain-containing protein n=1 Tax=Halomarina litorea TaxID=2961595 RepID=UPI0020C55E47|nr:endonuclease NucS domain-containing protein [Halomarina sp. BCD28]
MSDSMRVVAGECTTEFTGSRERAQRGHVVCLCKPDNTVLVHDVDGYQPVAWLTRPESLSVGGDPLVVEARDGDQHLRVTVHREHGMASYPASVAGVPVGTCPECAGAGTAPERGGTLVRSRGAVECLDCGARHGIPTDATVLDSTCEDCGLPTMRVERGAAFEVCLDRSCESLDDAVAEAFDRAWDCPDCGSSLRILRRGGLIAGCDAYPDCETAFAVPEGVVAGTCDCGLPALRTSRGVRCLDSACEASADAP